jgi:predicted DNA-binding transcriptional regulator YafY
MNRRFSLECQDHVQFLTDLLKAAENQWSVKLNYPRSTELATRNVNPLGVFFGHNAWYVTNWDQNRKDYRTFAVNRIRSLELLPNKPFKRPEGFARHEPKLRPEAVLADGAFSTDNTLKRAVEQSLISP